MVSKFMTIPELADNIFKRIYVDGPFTFDQLEARAIEKGIDIDDFYAAMEIVQRHRKLRVTGKKYEKRVNRPDPVSHTTWIRQHYPPMETGVNDASHPVFDGIDYSYLFMTPDEAKEYKLSLKGGYAGRKNSNPYSLLS